MKISQLWPFLFLGKLSRKKNTHTHRHTQIEALQRVHNSNRLSKGLCVYSIETVDLIGSGISKKGLWAVKLKLHPPHHPDFCLSLSVPSPRREIADFCSPD